MPGVSKNGGCLLPLFASGVKGMSVRHNILENSLDAPVGFSQQGGLSQRVGLAFFRTCPELLRVGR